ncbi:MAG: hypothetical protein MI923_25200 [Phycisphaerales bacterium]|nr:hypothetical protein [Phycisphaerales bacterium]
MHNLGAIETAVLRDVGWIMSIHAAHSGIGGNFYRTFWLFSCAPTRFRKTTTGDGVGSACDVTAGQPCPGTGMMTMSMTMLGVGCMRYRRVRRR